MTDALTAAPLNAAIEHWRLESDGPVQRSPTGQVGFFRQNDRPVVLKVPSPDADEARSHKILHHYDGCGAVKLLDHTESAFLLERACPGTHLTEMVVEGRDDEATRIVCGTIDRLCRPPSLDGLPTVEDWGKGFDRYRTSENQPLPADLVERAADLFITLAESQSERVPLHGDLHHDNILYDRDRGWLAIDPKGVIGEREYETGAFLRNPTRDPGFYARREIVDRRVKIINDELGFSADRIIAWAFAQVVLSAIWCVEDGQDPTLALMTARAIAPMF